MIKPISCLAAAALVSGLAGAAMADTYTCKITPAGTSHAIPTDVIVKHDTGTGTVTVIDGIIQHYVGGPIAGVLKSKNAKRALFTWTVSGVKNSTGQYAAGLTYSLNIQLASGTAQMTGKPQGYSNSWRGSGNCTVR